MSTAGANLAWVFEFIEWVVNGHDPSGHAICPRLSMNRPAGPWDAGPHGILPIVASVARPSIASLTSCSADTDVNYFDVATPGQSCTQRTATTVRLCGAMPDG